MPHILVIDDEAKVADSLAEVLRTAGYDVTAVLTGSQALAVVREFRPDLIICDVVMPEMNGVELARHLRIICPAPLILLSGHVATTEILEANQAAGVEVLAKPIHPRELLAKLRTYLAA